MIDSVTGTFDESMTVEALRQALDGASPPVLLDVREQTERALCAIDGSRHIPIGELPQRCAELPDDRVIAVYCHHGGRSARAVAWLRQRGYDRAINVAGGIDAWAQQIDPTLARY